MRLFVALTLPAKERNRIHRASRPLRDEGLPVRWVPSENYHVTLKFLGDVPAGQVDSLAGVLDGIGVENRSFSAELSGFGAFPTVRNPKLLWLAVTPSPALRCLKHDLERLFAQVGYEREARGFHPHVTLGRSQKNGGAGAFRGLDELFLGLDFSGQFNVGKVHLVRSDLTSEGSRYSVVSTSKLG